MSDQNFNDLFQFYIDDINFNEVTKSELESMIFTNKNFDAAKSTGRFVAGYASTADWDTDGESVVQKGLDIEYYVNQGFLNWLHINKPDHIVGIPVESRIDEKGFFTKGMLFKNQMANDIWKLADELKSLGHPRRLGFSIEGKVLQRSSINKSKIVKAKVTNVAITHIPVNTSATFEAVTKSFVPPTYDEVIRHIKKDIVLSKNLAGVASPGLSAGHQLGGEMTDGDALRVESLDDNERNSKKLMEEKLFSAYKSIEDSEQEIIKIFKSINPLASDNLAGEILLLIRKAGGFNNFIKIIKDSNIL